MKSVEREPEIVRRTSNFSSNELRSTNGFLTETRKRTTFSHKHSFASTCRTLTSRKKMSYPVLFQFPEHQIVEEGGLHCEPINFPEKTSSHIRSMVFEKAPERGPHYEDGTTLNEKRFENIEKSPRVSTRSKYIGKFLISKILPRKELSKKPKPGLDYNPKKEIVMNKTAYCKEYPHNKQ